MSVDDDASVDVFCQKYRQRLEYICVKRGIPFEDSRDLAQEALVSAIHQLRVGQFRGETTTERWLVSILSNKVVDFWRARGREGIRVSIQEVLDNEHRIRLFIPARLSDPELSLSIEETLHQLSDEHRMILLMNALEGYTTREIAKMLGRSEGRVGALLAEAKEMFRTITRKAEENLIRRRLLVKD